MVVSGERLVVFSSAVLVAGLIAAPQRTDNTAPTASVLGTGRGIDHAGIVVRDQKNRSRSFGRR